MAWEICNMKWGFAKRVLLKSQRQFMYGSNFYESDVIRYTYICCALKAMSASEVSRGAEKAINNWFRDLDTFNPLIYLYPAIWLCFNSKSFSGYLLRYKDKCKMSNASVWGQFLCWLFSRSEKWKKLSQPISFHFTFGKD